MSMRKNLKSDGELCCCEYIDINHRENHILSMCCSCEVLDDICDRLLCCKGVSFYRFVQLCHVISDRVRFPGLFGGGAKVILTSYSVPAFLVLFTHFLAIQGPVHTFISIVMLPVLLGLSYRVHLHFPSVSSSKSNAKNVCVVRRSPLLYHWTAFASFSLWVLFEIFVCTLREIFLWENLLVSTCFWIAMYLLFLVRKHPGVINYRSHKSKTSSLMGIRSYEMNGDPGCRSKTIMESDVTWVDSRPFKSGVLVQWCEICENDRSPRSGHCSVCGVCVSIRDHHCVWIDSCVGMRNHRVFFFMKLLFVFTGFYASHLSLTSVCTPEMFMEYFLYPSDCRFIYDGFQFSIGFSSALISVTFCSILAVSLLFQVILISQNITSQELHMARMRNLSKFFFFATNNLNNHGFIRNWKDFLFYRRAPAYMDSTYLTFD